MKDYLTRDNVLVVLGICFASFIFFGSIAFDNHKKIISIYSISTDSLRNEADELRINGEMMDFINDSLQISMNERQYSHDIFFEAVKNNSFENFRNKCLEMKQDIVNDIARFSKFEALTLNRETKQTYSLTQELLSSEKKIIDYMYETCIEKDQKRKDYLIAKIQESITEIIGSGKKIIARIKYKASKDTDFQNIQNEKKKEETSKIKSLNKSFYVNFFISAISIIIWVNIFVLAIRYETFKEKN